MNVHSDKIGFLFASQGTQWPGMARDLLADNAVFRELIARCDASIRRHDDWSLLDELTAPPNGDRLHRDPRMVQPALTSLQIGLVDVLEASGLRPAAVGSLSMGEAAGAYTAGLIDLDGAIDLAWSTARLAEIDLRPGLMAFVRATWSECSALIVDVADRVAVAVELGSSLTVISGEEAAVRGVMAKASAMGIGCGPLPLVQAYHSPDVATLEDGFKARLSNLASRTGSIDSYSSVTGRVEDEITIEHCWRICSQPALFYTLALAMIRDGYRRFVEIGPHPMLAQTVEEAAAHLGVGVEVEAVLHRNSRATESLADLMTWVSHESRRGFAIVE